MAKANIEEIKIIYEVFIHIFVCRSAKKGKGRRLDKSIKCKLRSKNSAFGCMPLALTLGAGAIRTYRDVLFRAAIWGKEKVERA